MYSFNLRTQPWIPVVDLKGDLLEVNLEEALLGAKRYKQIASDNPLEVAALHRFLLAVLHRALKGPSSAKDKARYLTQGFEGVEGYLQEFHHRFDLFDERWPFYQVPELPLEGNTQPHTRLSSRYGPNNTSALYNLKRPKAAALTSGISPAQAARSLLEHQTFCLGSLIQRFITSAPGAPAATSAHTLVLGDNLHQTLCLNLVHYPEHHSDQAVWEVAPPSIPYLQKDPQVVPKGLVHRYTWLARSIRLFPEVHDGQVVVRSLAYASGERPKDYGQDPMLAYRFNKGDIFPLRLSTESYAWRNVVHCLLGTENTQPPAVVQQAQQTLNQEGLQAKPKALVMGLISDQSKLEAWRYELWPLDSVMAGASLKHLLEPCLEQAQALWQVLQKANQRLAKLMLQGSFEPDPKNVSSLSSHFPTKEVYWSRLKAAFLRLLENIVHDPDRAQREWQETLWHTAHHAWEACAMSVGTTPRGLKALTLTQRGLFFELKPFEPTPTEQDTPPTEQDLAQDTTPAEQGTTPTEQDLAQDNNPAEQGTTPTEQDLAEQGTTPTEQETQQAHPKPTIKEIEEEPQSFEEQLQAGLRGQQAPLYRLVASLYALHPKSSSAWVNLGGSLGRLYLKDPSVEQRFVALLEAGGDLEGPLRYVVMTLKNEGIAINWPLLLQDLLLRSVNPTPVNRRWAQAFYSRFS